MAGRYDSLDWTDLNSLRRYPIREGSSAVSDDGLFFIPDDFIVDATICASSDASTRVYISRIFNKLTSVVVEFSDNNDIVIGSFEIQVDTHTLNKDYYLIATDDYVGANGKLTIGNLSSISQQPAGNFAFSIYSTELEPRTVIPSMRGVSRIKFVDALTGTHSLTGDVVVRSRVNLLFSYEDLPDNQIIWDAGDGLGLNRNCSLGTCVKTINGVAPDPLDGNISLLGIDCLSVTSTLPYTLDLSDNCCTPCSGCDDLATLTTRLTSLENKFIELKGNYINVNTQLTTYLSTVNSNCSC